MHNVFLSLRGATMIAATAGMLLTACSKDEASPAPAESAAPEAVAIEEAKQRAEIKAREAALPKPDATKPLAEYPELDSGVSIMALYVAASRLPPDYEKLSGTLSSEYRSTSDTFRKRDLLQALKPQVDELVSAAKANPYGWMEVGGGDQLAAYNFERGGFPVREFEPGKQRYFSDASEYKLQWANAKSVGFLPVKDEALARQIEAMRNDYGKQPRLRIYFFAQSTDLNDQSVKAHVTRVQVVDSSGQVLAEYGPDEVA